MFVGRTAFASQSHTVPLRIHCQWHASTSGEHATIEEVRDAGSSLQRHSQDPPRLTDRLGNSLRMHRILVLEKLHMEYMAL